MTNYTVCILFFIAMGHVGLGQEADWGETGEIEDAQVIIEKNRKIELPAANRTYEKAPPTEVNKEVKPQQYDFNENVYGGAEYKPSLKVSKLSSTNKTASYNNYVKLGFGNYVSPLGELSLNAIQNNISAGLSFKHLSFARGAVDGSSSGSSDNIGGLFVNLNNKKNVLHLGLDFGSVKRKHYGFSDGSRSSIDPTKQKYNSFGINLGFKNTDTESLIDYSFKTAYYHIDDNFNAKESGFTGRLLLSALLVDNISLFSEAGFLLTKYQDITEINRNLIDIKGGVGYELGPLSIRAGVNIVLTNDTISNSNDFKLYPHITAKYKLSEQWSAEGGLVGDLEAVTLKSIVKENPFIAQNIPLVHTNKQIEIFGKISGLITHGVNLSAGVSFANYENFYFYTDTLRFSLAYERDATNVLNLFTSLSFNHKDNLSITTRLDYFNYATDVLPEAWHRPSFTSNLSIRYKLNDKLNFGSSLLLLSGVKTFNPETNSTDKLDTIVDLGFDANYQINDKFNAFVEFDNLLGKKYERFINYLNRSFMTHVGVSYSF